ncbi:hypothetical protein DMA11_11530 [Marinilabiliaceae bacterium JC017]|nr:hypothetical protein DMA11_11530 [Marinilabiliaceae bacterium JC017]
MIKTVLDPKFEKLQCFATNLHQNFEKYGVDIHIGRNQLKTFHEQDHMLCVKAFGRPTLANIIIYSFFRKNKAARSYLYAQRLLEMGIHTPAPVGYIEVYNKWKILTKCYYISMFHESTFSLSTVLNEDVPQKKAVLSDFAAYTAGKLHAQGIFHKDFNGANVLINYGADDHYHFSLIDLNRVRFDQKIGHRKALVNLKMLCGNPISLAMLAEYYAREKKEDPTPSMFQIIVIKYMASIQRRIEKSILHFLKKPFAFKLASGKAKG